MTYEIEAILLIPLIAAVLCGISPKERMVSWISIILMAADMVITILICGPVFIDGSTIHYSIWYVDGLSSMFLMITATVAFMVTLYSHGYMGFERDEKKLTMKSEKMYYLCLNLFVAAMLGVFTVSSVGIIWIIIEATTLISTFLVGFYHDEHSTEASWKYLIICSVGITLALLGISLVYASAIGVIDDESSALNWPVLVSVASQLDPTLLKTAMVLIIVGFGTKAGLAPMHTWLPDAHSQAPTPISALLSATLLNCALYSILRFYIISEIAIPGFASTLLLIFGFVSLFIAAMFILNSKDIKRMLAYSSIEHIGLISIGFGIGTKESIFAALFMIVAHSMTKPILFFCAGNILQEYKTKDMGMIRGLSKKMPFTAAMLSIGTIAIIGMPPFAVFMGELALLLAIMGSGMWILSIIIIVLLIIIFAGFTLHIYPMMTGETDNDVHDPKGIVRAMPFVILTGVILVFGLFVPDSIVNGFHMIADNIFEGVI